MKLKKNQGYIIGGFILALVTIVIVVLAIKNKPQSEPVAEEPARKRLSEPVNIIPVLERAYVSILPVADGRNLTISINHLSKEASSVEYELEYQSGSMLQGAMGVIDLSQLPNTEEVFLGSCSAGGACTYHTDISGGNLLLTFIGPENYALKTNWRYIDNTTRSSEVASWDAKFQLNSPALTSVRYSIVFNSPGIPSGLGEELQTEFEIISDIYALNTSSTSSGEGKLTIRLLEDSETATIVGYDGNGWTQFETTIEDKVASATVELMELYLVVR